MEVKYLIAEDFDDNQAKYLSNFIPYDYSRITLKNFKSYMSKNQWEGDGSIDNPLIINNVNGLAPRVILYLPNMHIIIKDIVLWSIILVKCKNVKITNCTLNRLTLKGCLGIMIEDNNIFSITNIFSRECEIINNKLSKRADLFLQDQIHDAIFKPLTNLTLIFALVSAVLIYVLFPLPYRLFYISFIANSILVIDCIAATIFCSFYYYKLRKYNKYTAHNKENHIGSNGFLEDHSQYKLQIIKIYQDYKNRHMLDLIMLPVIILSILNFIVFILHLFIYFP